MPTATIADSPRRQPPGPASSSGSGPCAWPQAEACFVIVMVVVMVIVAVVVMTVVVVTVVVMIVVAVIVS